MKKKILKILSILLIIFTLLISITLSSSKLFASSTDFNYVDAFAKSIMYYEASWCGPDAGNNRLPWRGPCHIEDGKDVGLDLTGGFHDAGDHVKFGQPQAYAASTLGWAYYEFKDTFKEKGQDKYMLNTLKHFTDYFLKCYPNKTTFYYQCGDGAVDHAYWGPPELQSYDRPTLFVATPQTPASDMCGDTAASLALMYLNYKEVDEDYAEKCLTAAKDLYTFGKTYKGLGDSGGFYGSSFYWDELCWGAIWLNIATGDALYLDDVKVFLEGKGITEFHNYANHWTHCWDDVFGGVFVKLAQITDSKFYKSVAEENLNYFMTNISKTPGGVVYLNGWGALRYTAAECMMAIVYYNSTKEQKYLDFTKAQIDYILGKNPRNSSYVVGFGENYPMFPHHRAASGRFEWQPANEHKKDTERHLLYGALVGGPDFKDNYSDDIESYECSEVAIDYNAGFVGAMAGISKFLGGDQKALDTPGIEDKNAIPFYTDAKVLEEDANHVTIGVFMHNESILPPVFAKNLQFRYFIDLSEYYTLGLTYKDIMVTLNYGAFEGALSQLKAWDENNHIYYVEGSWPKTDIYGNVEMQFAMSYYNPGPVWDSSNDYSYKGLSKTTKTVSKNLPVYLNGKLLFGEEPTKNQSTSTTSISTTIATVSVTTTPTNSNTKKLGDVNGDGKINSTDISLIERHTLGISSISETYLNNADLNKDNKINSTDISLVERFTLGMIDSL